MSCCGGMPIFGDIEKAVNDVGAGISHAADAVGDTVNHAANAVGSALSQADLEKLASGIFQPVGNVFESIGNDVNHAANAVGSELNHIGDVIATDPIAKAAVGIGLALATAGASSALSGALLESGIVTSAAVADAAATTLVNAGVAMAQGVPPDKALQSGLTSLVTSQVISPAISSEVRDVIDSPLGQTLATNAGTTAVVGALQGKSGDQIAKAMVGSATGTLANAAGQEVGSQVLANIEDPTIAKIAADAANAGTKAAVMGQDVGKAALNAGATTAAHSDLGGYDIAGALPSFDMSGIKEAIQPISDAATAVLQPVSDVATQVLQPLEQPIKNVAQAGSDAATQVLQPLEQPIKNVAQAGSDAVTSVLQPLEQPIKNIAQAGSDAATSVLQPISDAVSNLPSVDLPNVNLPKITLPKVTGALPTATASTPVATTAAPTTTASNSTSPWLDSTPQMLKAAPVNSQNPAHMAQLKQLYQSLTPEMQDAFAMHGIQDPEMAAQGGHIGHYATGGKSDFQTAIDNMMPQFAKAPTTLEAAPVVSQPSRLGALKPLRAGLSTHSQASGLAAGGLPHKYAEAAPEGHKPEFITGVTGYYAQGGGTGQSDDIPAMLHDGDYVIDAEAVSALGDGSSKAGAEALAKFQSQFRHHDDGASRGKPVPAKIADGEYVFPAAFVTALGGGDNKKGAKLLDDMRVELRMHKRAAPTSKIPPKALSPLDYLEHTPTSGKMKS